MECQIFEKNAYVREAKTTGDKKRNVEETNNIGRRRPKYIHTQTI